MDCDKVNLYLNFITCFIAFKVRALKFSEIEFLFNLLYFVLDLFFLKASVAMKIENNLENEKLKKVKIWSKIKQKKK